MNLKNSLSVIIIAKNEEKRLEECIQRVRWADEIIVVDNGSTDATVTIAKQNKAIVVVDTSKNFSDLRNTGSKSAHGEWILYIDADEIVSRELHEEIISTVRQEVTFVGYFISRQNFYLGTKWPTKDKMVRLIYKKALQAWVGKLHEHPEIDGKIGELQTPLQHYTHRSIREMVDKTNEWSEIEANLRVKQNHPPMVWWRFLRVMMTGFLKSYVTEQGWKAGTTGVVESIYQAFSMFITYAKLWEKQQKQ